MENMMNEMMMNMTGIGCCVVATSPEEMQVLMDAVAGYSQKEKATTPTQEQTRTIAAGVLVYQLNTLVEQLETLGYDICIVDETHYPSGIDHDFYWNEAKLDVKNKRVLI